MEPKLRRLIALAESFFDVANDPDQLAVDEAVLGRLRALHPATVGEAADADGPHAWTLVIPATREVMEPFLAGALSERQLFEATHPGDPFDAVYLCSALVLPEYRGAGIAKGLLCASIRAIRRDHPISVLCFWPFSPEGEHLAAAVAAEVGLPLAARRR